jgi:hypothetical protein
LKTRQPNFDELTVTSGNKIHARFLALAAAGLSAFFVSGLAVRFPLMGSNISF